MYWVAVIALMCGLVSFWTMITVGLPEGGVSVMLASIFGMFLTQMVFMALGLLFSALARDYKRAMRFSMIALLWGFALCFSIQYAGNIDFLRILTPIWYFPVLEVLERGVSLPYTLLSVLMIVAAICRTMRLYRKKEFYA